VQTRSDKSLMGEAKGFIKHPQFKGNIADVGGPTANFTGPACSKQGEKGSCKGRECLYPQKCPNLIQNNKPFVESLRKLRQIEGVKRVYVRSGIRYDYFIGEIPELKEFCQHHVSGQLKVAPEHSEKRVLDQMGKPSIGIYKQFKKDFLKAKGQKKEYLIPYFISSHPGSDLKEALKLALFLKKEGFVPDQVQDFYPTPGTLATCMYYTGIDPLKGTAVYVPRGERERKMQRALLQFHKIENKKLVLQALKELGRKDLIGYGPQYLISPGR